MIYDHGYAVIFENDISTEKGKEVKAEGDCSEWVYGRCVPNSGDCGLGVREGTCNEQTKKYKCKVPCNWKKDFGGKGSV